MSSEPFDYFEEARKLIAFANRVCMGERVTQEDKITDPHGKHTNVEDEAFKSEYLKNADSLQQITTIKKSKSPWPYQERTGMNLLSPQQKVEVRQQPTTEKQAGNGFLQNSDFVKFSDSDEESEEIDIQSTVVNNGNTGNSKTEPVSESYRHMQDVRKTKNPAQKPSATSHKMTESDSAMRSELQQENRQGDSLLVQNKKNDDYLSQEQGKKCENLVTENFRKLDTHLAQDDRIRRDFGQKVSIDKSFISSSQSKNLRTQQEKEKRLLESAKNSSNIVFTLLGEPSVNEGQRKRSKAASWSSLPPPASPPLPPPPPPYPVPFVDLTDSQYQNQNAEQNIVVPVQSAQTMGNSPPNNIDDALSTNRSKSWSINSNQKIAFPANNNIFALAPNQCHNNLRSEQQVIRGQWCHQTGSVPSQSSSFGYQQISPQNISIRPTSTNNRMESLPNKRKQSNNIPKNKIANLHSNHVTRNNQRSTATGSFKNDSRNVSKNIRKKKTPKSLKRINGMVKKHDLEDHY